MRLSVIIVSWNAKSFLLQCVQSVLNQAVPAPLEIIVVDNASTDGAPDAVERAFPTVRVIRNEANLGFARANNIGIRASSGDYLLLINSDVVVTDDCFQQLVQYAETHPAVGILGPQILGADGQVQRSCMGYPSLWNSLARALALDSAFPRAKGLGGQLLTFWDHSDTRPVDVINGCFWMVRRTALAQVGLLDERFLFYGEDIDWCRRFNQCGWQVVFYTAARAIHYGGASSSSAPVRFHVEMQRAAYQYWRKHYSRTASTGFLGINLLHHTCRLAGELLAYPWRHQREAASHRIERAWASIRWTAATMMAIWSGGYQAIVESEQDGARTLQV